MADEYNPFDPNQDMIARNEIEAAQIRTMANGGADSLQESVRNLHQNAATTGHWILGSMLAMNSGGAVAVLSASDKVIGPLGPSLVSFAIGATLALGTGINGLVTGLRVGPILGDAIQRLRLSAFENTIHASTKQRIDEIGRILRQQIGISAAIAAGSLLSFGVGIASAVT